MNPVRNQGPSYLSGFMTPSLGEINDVDLPLKDALRSGLACRYLKDGRFTTYTTANGLTSNAVTSIPEGSDGTM